MQTFRDCTGCAACCEGHLIGNAHGNSFGAGKPCVFLEHQQCVIYDTRPEVCSKYQCAWSQDLFDTVLEKPSESGLLVSVEQENGLQYLKCIEVGEYQESDLEYIKTWAKSHNTYVKLHTYEDSHNGTVKRGENNAREED